MKTKSAAQASSTVSDLRRFYPDMERADPDYPPLKFRSVKGKVSAAEWQARVDCACAYRLVRLFKMDDLVYNHISVRIPGTDEYLLNAMGLMYDEICASSLLKVDLKGKVLWEPEWPKGLEYTFNYAGFVIHGAIHEAKHELHCVMHTHSPASMAVSSLKKGLLPMTQMAMRFDRVAYHDYQGVALDLEERKSLVEDLGDADVMLLRNHGALAVGRTVGEAFNSLYRLEKACVAQLLAQGANDDIVLPSPQVQEKTRHMYRRGVRRVVGLLEWPAMRRLADRVDPSYKI